MIMKVFLFLFFFFPSIIIHFCMLWKFMKVIFVFNIHKYVVMAFETFNSV